jgi:uncharacterized protein (DUF1800 family)
VNANDPSLFHDPRRAWEPYRPGEDGPWDAQRVAHLHRRAGLGATWAQLQRDVAEGFEPSLRRILDGESHGPDGQPASAFAATVQAIEDSAQRRPSIERALMLWLYRLIFTPHPLAEVMTLAWHSHYATSQAKVNLPELLLAQNNGLRQLWRAPISQLHGMILHDGAMLRWLDGLNSTKAHPNENLAREFLELFALGIGNYTERDVREVARALTGWREVEFQKKRDGFDPGDHDSGLKTILGRTGPWNRDDVVRLASAHHAAANHIARRLYRTFIADTQEPSLAILGPLASIMRKDDDVDVGRGIELVLRSRIFHSPECRGKVVKSPVALAIGAIRTCEAFHPAPNLVDLEIHLTRMGQRLFFPPSVAGWAGGYSWLGSSTILARANFAGWLVDPSSGMDPAHCRDLAQRFGLKTPGEWTLAVALLASGAPVSSETRDDLLRCLSLTFDPAKLHAVIFSRVLSLPESQLS